MTQKVEKQTNFVWEGVDKKGAKIKGEIRGASTAQVKAELRRQGLTVMAVKKKGTSLFGGKKRGKKITSKDISVFSRQMATMMTAGVPLVQSFEIIGRGHDNPSMQELILTIKSDVESGTSLTEAMRKHKTYFDDLFCNLVHSGEQAGILEGILQKIALYKEKTERIKSKIKKALIYPSAVVGTAVVITAILMIFVIPQFEALFKNFGADLPALTAVVVKMSRVFQDYWWLMLFIVVMSGYGIVQLKKTSVPFNHFLDRTVLKLPILGSIMRKAAIARYARTLATMFAAGVPLVEALDTVSGSTGNVVYGNAVLKMRDEIATGQQLQVAMRQTNLFPNMVVQMVAIGEESGSLDAMLSKVADFYEEEVDNAVDSLSTLLEPMIMAILGIIIGGLVIAMYLPIFKMGDVV